MPMTEESRVTLSEWVETLTDRLDTDFAMDEESMHIILDLARDAAHGIERPAAPLSTFLIGLAVGRGASLGAAAAQATELIQTMGRPGESD